MKHSVTNDRLYFTAIVFLALIFAHTQIYAQQASAYFPAEAGAISTFQTTVVPGDDEDDPFPGADVIITLESIAELDGGITQYTYSETGGSGVFDTSYFAIGDTLYTSLSDLADLGFLDDFDLDIDFDFDVRTDLMRLSADVEESWSTVDETFTIDTPDTLLALLPDGISIDDEIDIRIRFNTTRLEDTTIETAYGIFDTVVFKPALSIDLIIYIVVPIFDPIPVTLNLIESYGPEMYFAADYGLVLQQTPVYNISVRNSDFDIDEDIATLDGSIMELAAFETGTSNPVTPDPEIPSLLTIHPNYPNPFNPATKLNFDLAEPGIVSIRVYDTLGRFVDQVIAGQQLNAGTHSISYNAAALASGRYFYTIQFDAGNGNVVTQTSGFTLVK